MGSEQVKQELADELAISQYRKSVGLLSVRMVSNFVDIIEHINASINNTYEADVIIKKASLQPKTSEGKYWNAVQRYRGPLTIAVYEDKKFKIIRCEGDFDYLALHQPGILLHIQTNNEGKIGPVLKILKENISWSHFKVEEVNDDGLLFFMFLPMNISNMI